MLLLLFSQIFLVLPCVCLPPGYNCTVELEKCQAVGDNLVATVTGVVETGDCRLMCDQQSNCTHFTHFRSGNNLFQDTCMLFSSCTTLSQCQDCVTEELDCLNTCSIQFYGSVNNENFVELIEEVKTELDCKHACRDSPECKVYTYYSASDLANPQLCILLRQMNHPAQQCTECHTGSSKCSIAYGECKVSALVNTESGEEQKMYTRSSMARLVTGEQYCFTKANVLGVGGGGSDSYAGGGSGHVSVQEVELPAQVEVSIKVGDKGESTGVEVGGVSVLHAGAGNGGGYGGGSGYSGGGATGADGGSDGGDGHSHHTSNGDTEPGGKGSGFDVRSVSMTDFTLSPGFAGDGCYGNFCAYGGGGGGVLVNGESPRSGLTGGATGFGAGGNRDYYGLPGCVIIETL